MDPRVREHAELLVEWSARIEPGDNVVVSVAQRRGSAVTAGPVTVPVLPSVPGRTPTVIGSRNSSA